MSDRLLGFLAFVITFGFLCCFYGSIIFSPSSYMFSDAGDGIKNYYTLAWYLEHNTDWLWFEGMNHPDNELLTYTDAQPALAWVMRSLGISGSTGVGIINLLMLLSIAIAAWVYFVLLKTIGKASWLAAGFAVLLALVSPQIGRLGGHYSLAYMFVVPLFVLFIYRAAAGDKLVRNLIGLAILGIVMGFIHPYVLLMQVMFGGLVWGVILLQNRFRFRWKRDLAWLTSLLSPIVIVQIFMMLVDTKTDRPEDPWGFWIFQGDVRSVFAPQHGLLKKMTVHMVDYSGIDWETVAFVGSAPLILGLVAFGLWISRKAKVGDRNLWALLLASVVLLFFSFGYPFVWFPDLTDSIPFIKNFRVLGRFSWPFVCVFGVVAFVLMLKSRGRWTHAVWVIAGLLGTWEAVEWHQQVSNKIVGHENVFARANGDAPGLSKVMGEIDENTHGILSLPYFHVGSEKLVKGSNDAVLLESMKMSYQTGLPLLASQMSRSSLKETKDHLQLLAPFYYPKEIGNRLDAGTWIVVANLEVCSYQEKTLWGFCDSLTSENGLSFGSISTDLLIGKNMDVSLSKELAYSTPDKVPNVVWKTHKDKIHLQNEYTEVMVPKVEPGAYSFSCWYWNPTEARTETAVILERTDTEGNASWDAYETLDRAYAYSGDSIRFELKMNLPDSTSQYRVLLKQPTRSPKEVYVNHLMLKPEEATVVLLTEWKGSSINNHMLHEAGFIPQ